MRRWSIGMVMLALSGCGGGAASSSEVVVSDEASGGEGAVVIEDDDPRVSRSAGEEGGVVVLFPRVMGLPDDEAARLQAHMVEVARRVFPNRPMDVRPDPERVCPRTGCQGISLGALLVVQDGACATVGIIGAPGTTDLTLTRWSGQLTVRDQAIPFREPPESHVTLHDRVPCSELEANLAQEDNAVEEAMRRAAGY